jgi:hypothetical protein
VFPSLRARGRVPLSASVFVADHLRSAAKKAGVPIGDGPRFGPHNLRHSLSNRMVNKGKVEPKTVQGILRHAKIQTTLDLYTQEDADALLARYPRCNVVYYGGYQDTRSTETRPAVADGRVHADSLAPILHRFILVTIVTAS